MSEDKKGEPVHKITLSTGKEVLLRDMKIKYQNLSLRAVGDKAGDNKALLGSMMQQELLKILLVQVDGKAPEKKELENLDSMFSYLEFGQLVRALDQIQGGGAGEFQTETVLTGIE